MKKFFVLFILSFTFGLLAASFIAYANQTSISTYYPSPSGNYTKIHLINNVGAGGPNANTCFCAVNSGNLSGKKAGNCDTGEAGVTYPNTGTIFSDPTKASVGNNATGYLEICKNDGTASSYPGSCFNRFGSVVAVPPCPNNYRETNAANQNFPMANGKSVTSWSCCFTGEGADTEAANLSITKSGCYSIYSTAAANVPVSCSTEDVNAYDVGCDYISSPDIIPPVFKRNCCFNDTTGGTLQTSKCGGNCLLLPTTPAGAYTSCTGATPAVDTNSTVLNSCAAPAAPCTFVCAAGYILDPVIPNQCDPKPCDPNPVNSNGDVLTFPKTASSNTATVTCTAYSATTGWTGTLSDYCYLGVWAGYTGACAPDPCLAMSGPGADNAHEVSSISAAISGGWGTGTCDAGYCSSQTAPFNSNPPQYSCSLGTFNLATPTNTCSPCPCTPASETLPSGVPVTLSAQQSSGNTETATCPGNYQGYIYQGGATGAPQYLCTNGSWSVNPVSGSCVEAPPVIGAPNWPTINYPTCAYTNNTTYTAVFNFTNGSTCSYTGPPPGGFYNGGCPSTTSLDINWVPGSPYCSPYYGSATLTVCNQIGDCVSQPYSAAVGAYCTQGVFATGLGASQGACPNLWSCTPAINAGVGSTECPFNPPYQTSNLTSTYDQNCSSGVPCAYKCNGGWTYNPVTNSCGRNGGWNTTWSACTGVGCSPNTNSQTLSCNNPSPSNGGSGCSLASITNPNDGFGSATCLTADPSGVGCDLATINCYPSYTPQGTTQSITNGTVLETFSCIPTANGCVSRRGNRTKDCDYIGCAPTFDRWTEQTNSCSCTYPPYAGDRNAGCADQCSVDSGSAVNCVGNQCSLSGADECCTLWDSYGHCCDGSGDRVDDCAVCNGGTTCSFGSGQNWTSCTGFNHDTCPAPVCDGSTGCGTTNNGNYCRSFNGGGYGWVPASFCVNGGSPAYPLNTTTTCAGSTWTCKCTGPGNTGCNWT